MKKMFKFTVLLFFLFSLFSVYGCSFNYEIDGTFNENEKKKDIAQIEFQLSDPKPLMAKDEYVTEIEKIFEENFVGTKLNLDYAISYEKNESNFFEVGEEIFITALEKSELIYSNKPIKKKVDYISLSNFESEIDYCKPKTGDNIESSLKNFYLCIEEKIKNVYQEIDFIVTYENQKNDIWSKNDIIYINCTSNSKILKGSLKIKLILLDLSTLDYSDIIPRNNQSHEKVRDNFINKIKSYSRNSVIDRDYYIKFESEKDYLVEGDVVILSPEKNSNMIGGGIQKFTVETFNLKNIENEFENLDLNFGISKNQIENQIENLIFSYIPTAKVNIDYSIKYESKYETLYPGSKILIKPISSSEYLIGNEIKLVIPKLNINYLKDYISEFQINIGNTTKIDYKNFVYERVKGIFADFIVENELEITFSKKSEFFLGDEEIFIKSTPKSTLFSHNDKGLSFKLEKHNSKKLKEFLDQFIFTELENSIDINAGLSHSEVYELIDGILQVSQDFKMLLKNRDYKLEFSNENEILRTGDIITFVILGNSDFIEGSSFFYKTVDYNLNILKPEIDALEIQEGEKKIDINEKIRKFINDNKKFINFDEDIEINFVRNDISECFDINYDCVGESENILARNEKIELVLKKREGFSSIDQKIELEVMKSENLYIDLSCAIKKNEITDFNSNYVFLKDFKIDINELFLENLATSDLFEMQEFEKYLQTITSNGVDGIEMYNMKWFSLETNEWKVTNEEKEFEKNKNYKIKIEFKDDFVNLFLENKFNVFNSFEIKINIKY